jgi:hypothetical protein
MTGQIPSMRSTVPFSITTNAVWPTISSVTRADP